MISGAKKVKKVRFKTCKTCVRKLFTHASQLSGNLCRPSAKISGLREI
jgi:hypothetical protein